MKHAKAYEGSVSGQGHSMEEWKYEDKEAIKTIHGSLVHPPEEHCDRCCHLTYCDERKRRDLATT